MGVGSEDIQYRTGSRSAEVNISRTGGEGFHSFLDENEISRIAAQILNCIASLSSSGKRGLKVNNSSKVDSIHFNDYQARTSWDGEVKEEVVKGSYALSHKGCVADFVMLREAQRRNRRNHNSGDGSFKNSEVNDFYDALLFLAVPCYRPRQAGGGEGLQELVRVTFEGYANGVKDEFESQVRPRVERIITASEHAVKGLVNAFFSSMVNVYHSGKRYDKLDR